MGQKSNAAGDTRAKKIKGAVALCICIIVAFFMWVYVMMVDSPEYKDVFEGITVNLTGTDSLADNELAIFNGYGVKVDVTLAGKKSVLSRIRSEDLVVSADVSAVKTAGRYSIKLVLDTPVGCKLVSISQDTVSVYVDVASYKTVDLAEYRENTSLPESCFTGEIVYPFDKVTVSGPLDVLNGIEGAMVTLDMSGVTKTTTLKEKIVLVDGAGNAVTNPYVDYYPREVTVEVPVLMTVRVPIEVQYKNGFLSYDNTRVNIIPESIEVTGDSEIISKGNLIEPIVIDERTAFDTGWYDSIVTIEHIDGVELSAQKAKVSIELSGGYVRREYSIPEENIYPAGANDGVKYSWKTMPVTVALIGPADVLSDITSEDLSLVFDMSPYSDTNVGTIRVRADAVIHSDLASELFVVGQYYVNVTFEKNDE